MLSLALTSVLLASPQLKTWTGQVRGVQGATVTIYPSRALAADHIPCLSDATKTLIDERCVDEKSVLALVASVRKEAALTALATAKTDADGRFKVQVPRGHLFVRVEDGNFMRDYVVDPLDGVETVLYDNAAFTRGDLIEEIGALIDARATPEELAHDIWVIGQDNPQVVRLDPAQIATLLEGAFKGPNFFVGCSRVVTATGRELGTTCETAPKRNRGFGHISEVTLTGTVSFEGKPRAGVMVRKQGAVDGSLTDARGRFAFDASVEDGALLIVEAGELRAAEIVTTTFKDRLIARPLSLRLSKAPLPTLRVRDEAGLPVPNANVRFWYRGRAHESKTDERGECIAPTSLTNSYVSVTLLGKAPFGDWLDLTRAEPVVLRPATTLEVSFRSPDGVLMYQPDVRCQTCDVLESRPSRIGRVVLALHEGPAIVSVAMTELVVSKNGPVVVVPRRAPQHTDSPPAGFTVKNVDGLELDWSTPTNQPQPGRQFVRASDGIRSETRLVDVPDAGTLTIAPLTMHKLEVTATGFTAGAEMPSSVSISGPHLRGSEYGHFDRDGVAKFARLPPGPWRVTVELQPLEKWCFEGQPCTVDLASLARKSGLTLRGAVPKFVELDGPDLLMNGPMPVHNGVVDWKPHGPLVVERTTLSVDDGGTRIVQLASPVDVQVKVVDGKNKPVSDALVSLGLPRYGWLGRAPELSDAKGVVVFPRTRPGNLPVRVAKAGYAVATTVGTQAQNTVMLSPGANLTCKFHTIREPTDAICSAAFDGGELEGQQLHQGTVTLRDLPMKQVTARLEVIEHEPLSNWLLEKTVDLSTSTEVTFEIPRRGRVLVLPTSGASVLVDGVGRVYCTQLGEHFCQTPPVPEGRVTIVLPGRRFPFDVPPGEDRLLVAMPEERSP